MKSLLSYVEALLVLEKNIAPCAPCKVNWRDSLWTTLAEDVNAREAAPLFDNSAMDGYAVCSEDVAVASPELPVALQVKEEIYAGKSLPQHSIEPGFATQIMTGAPVPEGADAVVMVEKTQREDGRVLIYDAVEPGQNIRKEAEEIKKGEKILFDSDPIGPAERGLLAQQGIQEVLVRKNPTIAVLATGDELVEPEEPIEGGLIRNSNTYTLTAEIERIHCKGMNLGISRDVQNELKSKIEQACEQADFLLTSGGVSAGEKDYLPALLAGMGMQTLFHKVAVKPGKPLLFGKLNDTYIFGLPGNVVSSLVSFHLFVKPAIRLFTGREHWRNEQEYARMGEPMQNRGRRTNFIRCRLSHSPTGLPIALPTGKQGSGMLSSMRNADGLAVLPADKEVIAEFDVVEFIRI